LLERSDQRAGNKTVAVAIAREQPSRASVVRVRWIGPAVGCPAGRVALMLRLISHRLLVGVPVLFIMTALSFVLVSFLPGDAARTLLGETASPEQVAQLRAQLGLDRPLLVQYWEWLKNLFHGDLGSSLLNSEPVADLLQNRLSVTLILVTATTVVATILGVAMGFLSALRGGWFGRVMDAISFAGIAIPNFWIGLTLVAVFAVAWPVLPPNGYVQFADSPLAWAQSLVLPVTALSIGTVAAVATQTRDSTLDALGRDFVRVEFANGFSTRSIAWKHVLRNAAPAICTVVGLVFVGLVGGAVLIETVFALPGLGQGIVSATLAHDIPVIQGAVLYLTIFVLLANLAADIVLGWVDPRTRVR
jgi:peptide/nickel transport system permease protein